MADLDRERDVIRMARELGLEWRHHPARRIVEFCVNRITGWLNELRGSDFTSIDKIERFICAKLKLVIEEVHNEADIDAIVQKYAVEKREGPFANLRTELDDKTFGVLMRRQKAGPIDRDKYVAVIDCRGEKALRKFFSRWHEIAHMLTLYQQLALPLHRSQNDGSPLERLMDMIAGEIGFYGPILEPALEVELRAAGRLTFGVVDDIHASFFPDASFQATLFACLNRTVCGAAYLEFGLGYKKSELKAVKTKESPFVTGPKPKLRVLKCSSNTAAHDAGIVFHRNMEVPACSSVFRRFHDAHASRTSRENLANWAHSDGSTLENVEVHIETRRIRDGLVALVTPARENVALAETKRTSGKEMTLNH